MEGSEIALFSRLGETEQIQMNEVGKIMLDGIQMKLKENWIQGDRGLK